MAQRTQKAAPQHSLVARETSAPGVATPLYPSLAVPVEADIDSEETAQAFAQAFANTEDAPDQVDLQYAQASEEVLSSDWLGPEESDAWQAMPPVI
ncbi:MAG: hypothetical protein M3Z04_13475 [Chloroflexota bacterium]|nr:hypothetical protein [Chloroflexota bacterium]